MKNHSIFSLGFRNLAADIAGNGTKSFLLWHKKLEVVFREILVPKKSSSCPVDEKLHTVNLLSRYAEERRIRSSGANSFWIGKRSGLSIRARILRIAQLAMALESCRTVVSE